MIFEKREGCVIGRSNLLSQTNGLVHGISTRIGGVSQGPYDSLNLGRNTEDDPACRKQNESIFLSALGFPSINLALLNQVHEDKVAYVTKPGTVPATDALITDQPNLLLIIQTADCVPLLFYDPVRKAVGAAHAGWRGTQLDIAGKTIRAMTQQFNSNPQDILAFIGPSIGPCCFEVGNEVLSQFPSQYHTAQNTIDLWQINRDQLLHAGLNSANIELSHLCTVCQQDTFFSHRGSDGRTGRMWSGVGITEIH